LLKEPVSELLVILDLGVCKARTIGDLILDDGKVLAAISILRLYEDIGREAPNCGR